MARPHRPPPAARRPRPPPAARRRPTDGAPRATPLCRAPTNGALVPRPHRSPTNRSLRLPTAYSSFKPRPPTSAPKEGSTPLLAPPLTALHAGVLGPLKLLLPRRPHLEARSSAPGTQLLRPRAVSAPLPGRPWTGAEVYPGRGSGARSFSAADGEARLIGAPGAESGDESGQILRTAGGRSGENPGPSDRPVSSILPALPCGGPAKMSNPFLLKQVFNKDKTFRPKRKFEPGTQRFELHKKAQASLNAGLDLKLAVQLPAGEELNDWVAVHVVDFFNRINLIYGTISDGCTERSCPIMSGGPKYEYRWQDENKFRRPTALSAPRYMDLLMDWVEVQINNEDVFPTNVGTPFPKNFLQVVKKILSRLFRVFVHVYIHHFDRIAQLGSEAHVNTCYKHFYYFVTEFGLIDTKELEPLKEMTARMCH